MKKVTVDDLKVLLRETGVKRKRSMYGNRHIVSLILTKELVKRLDDSFKKLNKSRINIFNEAISKFNPIKTEIKMFMTPEEIKSTVGFFNLSKPDKIFNSRKDIVFSSTLVTPDNYDKIKQLQEYYGLTRAATMRIVLDSYLNSKGF